MLCSAFFMAEIKKKRETFSALRQGLTRTNQLGYMLDLERQLHS